MPRRILISINSSWNIYNYRAGLVRNLKQKGYDVVTAAPSDRYSPQLRELGCSYIALPIDSTGYSPVRDAILFLRYLRLLRSLKPDAYLGYTIKPNVYGSVAAHLLGVPVINNISGLGTAFVHKTWLTALVKVLYRLALRGSRMVFFQNSEDRDHFIRLGLVRGERSALLPGSGIDLEKFRPPSPPLGQQDNGAKAFLFIARLIWNKGVREYVEAARLVKRRFPTTRFQILGLLDNRHRSAVPRSQLDEWVQEGIVEYLGAADDVRIAIAGADCVVLPSFYPEGTPRALLEAAAMAKPIITTNTPGCRDVVENGINGFLCAARDSKDLAEKLIAFLSLDPAKQTQMGIAGRSKAEASYDERIVVARYLAAIEGAATKP